MKKILLTILAVLAMSGMAMAQTAPSDINLHRNDDGSWSFIMPGRNLVMITETFSTNDTVNGHYLAGVPEGWLILALGDTVPVSNDSLRRTTPITEGTPLTIVPPDSLKKRIKSITLVDELPPALAPAFKDGAKFKVGYQWNGGLTTYLEFTNSGGTYSLTSVSGDNTANGFNSSTLTVMDGNVLALDVVCHPEGEDRMDYFCAQIEFDATSSTYEYSSKGSYFDGIISVTVNDADITNQLSEKTN